MSLSKACDFVQVTEIVSTVAKDWYDRLSKLTHPSNKSLTDDHPEQHKDTSAFARLLEGRGLQISVVNCPGAAHGTHAVWSSHYQFNRVPCSSSCITKAAAQGCSGVSSHVREQKGRECYETHPKNVQGGTVNCCSCCSRLEEQADLEAIECLSTKHSYCSKAETRAALQPNARDDEFEEDIIVDPSFK